MSIDLFDPTTSPEKTPIRFVPRPDRLDGLKVGLVDNSKFNSRALLIRIADRLKARFRVELAHTVTKTSPGHPVSDHAIEAFRNRVDFALAGIGD